MGLVGSAFLLTYTMLPPVFGWLGDRMRRTGLLALSGAAWCLATEASKRWTIFSTETPSLWAVKLVMRR